MNSATTVQTMSPKAQMSRSGNVSETQALTERSQGLSKSVDRWNDWYVWLGALALLIAFGVFWAQFRIIRKSKELSNSQSELIAAKDRQLKLDLDKKDSQLEGLRTRAKEADAKAEGFRLDIAKANGSAQLAEARAAEANLALARFKAPRSLSLSQQATIGEQLRPFGIKQVDMIIVGDSPEISDCTRDIVAALHRAGWIVNVVGKAVSGPNISGVFVGTHAGSDQSILAAAGALISSLQSAGIITKGFYPQFDDELPMAIMGTWDTKNVAAIRILVSTKP